MSKLYSDLRLLILTICLIVAWGISSFQVLPRMEDPNLSQRSAFITTSFPGANAHRVESLVTEEIEQKLFEISELKNITSTSRVGSSVIFVELQDEVSNVDEVWSQVRDKVSDVVPELPPEASEPRYEDIDARAYTLVTALVWNMKETPNYAILNRIGKEFESTLRSLPGTEKVEVFGVPQEEIVVEIDDSDLAALGLTTQVLSEQIRSSDARVPAGQVYGASNELQIEVETALDSLARIRQIPIQLGEGGQFSRLGDFATVKKSVVEPASEIALVDGKPAFVLATLMEPDWRIDKWTELTRQSIADFQQRLPSGIELQVVFDQSSYVENRLNELFNNLLLGALCVVVSTILLMGWKSALVVGSALPLSVLMVLGGMRILEIPLHQMSVTGLVIALGLLIDNAVVVVDEIQHKLKQGLKLQMAIADSLSHLAIPLLASTLTTILAFMPIVLLPGNTGEFVRTIALSVILALCSSLFLSLTVIPALIARLHRIKKTSSEADRSDWRGSSSRAFVEGFPADRAAHSSAQLVRQEASTRYQLDGSSRNSNGSASTFLPDEPPQTSWWDNGLSHPRLTAIYRDTLDGILTKPLLGILLALILPLTGFLTASTLEEQFFPPSERDQIYIELDLPPQASLEQTQSYALQVRDRILQHPEASQVFWSLGRDAPPFYYNLRRDRRDLANYAQGIVQLDSAANSQNLVKALQTELDRNFPRIQVLVKQLEQGPTVVASIELFLYGPNLSTLEQLGDRVRQELTRIPSVTHTSSSLGSSQPRLGLQVDEEQARLAGLEPTAIAQQLDASLNGFVGGSILEDTEEIPVRVRIPDDERNNLDRITSLNLYPEGSSGQLPDEDSGGASVPLSSLSEIELVSEPAIVSRRNGRRVNTIQGFIRAGVIPATVLEQLEHRLEKSNFQLPPGYSFDFGGEAAEREGALGNLTSTVGVLMMLMFALLVLSFGSFRSAGIIVLVAIGSVGLGLASLWWFDYPLGFMSILGIIGLIGVAINDSIVVLAALRSDSLARQGNLEAMREVIVSSTRHILTTTVTTVVGFIPLLIAGGGFWSPLAVCMVGGVSGATFLALYFVPCTYLLLTKKRDRQQLNRDRLKLKPQAKPQLIQWILYISGSLGLHLLINVLSTLLIYRYDPGMPNDRNLPLLVSSAWIGIAQLFGRTIGAFAQPTMGYFSDGFWSRWGKRRPFIAVGTLPVIVSFILLFMPPLGYSSTINLIYVTILLCLFYVSFAIYYIPYLAWLPVLAPNSEQTITLSTLMAVSSLIGTALGGIIAPWLTSILSFQKMGLIIGGIGLLTMLMPLANIEKFTQSPDPDKIKSPSNTPTFWNSCQTVWQTPSLRSHMLGFSLIWIAVTILTGCTAYIAVAILNKDLGFGGVLNGIFLGGVAIAFPLIVALAKRIGTKEALQTAMIWSGFGLIILGMWSILVGKGLSIWLTLLFLSSFGWAAFFILPNAILPDLVRKTLGTVGAQREAVYFGIRGFLAEISIGLGSLLTGLILTLGKTSEQPWGVEIALVIAGIFALASVKAFASKNKKLVD